jgi:acyl carrier protein
MEKRLAGIWAEVLGVERISVNDNFFALGGDSLSAAQTSTRVRKVFQVEIPLTTIFRNPILAGQALIIQDMILEEIERLPEEQAQRYLKQSK